MQRMVKRATVIPRGPLGYGSQLLDRFSLFRVELIEQAFFPQVKRATRLALRRGAFVAVVEAPTGGSARDGRAQVGDKILGRGIPFAVTAPKGFLIVNGRDMAEVFHPGKVFARLRFGLTW